MTAPYRILFEAHPFILGGSEYFLSNLIRALDAERYRATVVLSERGLTEDFFASRGIETWVEDYFRDASSLIGRLPRERIDLVLSAGFRPELTQAAQAAACPAVWRLGGHLRVARPHFSPPQTRDFLAAQLGRVRAVICPSQFLAAQFDGLAGAEKVSVIRNGVARAPTARHANPKLGDGPRIGMIARYLPQKRPLDLIHAAPRVLARFANARFYLFGAPDRRPERLAFASQMRDEIARLGLAESFFLGEAPEPRFDHYAAMDVFVLPATDEGASNGILEALELGKPVIAARSGGNPELVRHGETGLLVEPASVDQIADAILTLLDDSSRAERMGLAGREYARLVHDLEICAQAYMRVFDESLRHE